MAVIPHEQVPALDASYRTIRVLAEGPGGLTELVRGPQGQVLVRKRIPQELANVHAWMTLTRVESPLLPHIDSLYELDGDIVVLRQQDTAENGEIVAAMVQSEAMDEGEATLKRIFYEDDRVRLQPENSTMAPIYADDAAVLGKLVALFRQF